MPHIDNHPKLDSRIQAISADISEAVRTIRGRIGRLETLRRLHEADESLYQAHTSENMADIRRHLSHARVRLHAAGYSRLAEKLEISRLHVEDSPS